MANLKNTVISDTGFFKLPVGDTAARPASPAATQLRFNTDTGQLEQFRPGLGAWIAPSNTGVIATGGDAVYDVDAEGTTYRVHVFTSTGTSPFSVLQGGEVEYLIVAGGGPGGNTNGTNSGQGGGGGAGGLITGHISVSPQNYTITVGAGGEGVPDSSNKGSNGQNTTALGLTALGGGPGGGHRNPNGNDGGSGGGAGTSGGDSPNNGGNALQPGSSSGGSGNNGGQTLNSGGNGGGGGGGGAGGLGETGNGDASSANGGIGLSSNITGIFNFYAGGGASGAYNGPQRFGGLGGGGNGEFTQQAQSGTPNTGGGGGGGASRSGPAGSLDSGAGGSGIVIIRYPLRQNNPEVAAGKTVGDGLVLDLDFAKPTVYSGSGSVVTDSRLNGISGTLVNSPVFTDPRTHRSSFRFNGSDQTITGTGLPFSGNQQSFSFSIWARAFSRSGTYDGIFTLGGNSSSNDYEGGLVLTFRNNSTLRIRYWQDGGTNRTWTNTDFINGNWFNFTVVVENKNIKVYENNVVRVDAGFSNNWSLAGNYRIAQYPFSTNYLNGDVATVSVYNRALSGIEVSQYYNATRWRFGV